MQGCVAPVRVVHPLGWHLQIGWDMHTHTYMRAHTHRCMHIGLGGTMTDPEIQAIYWALLQPRPTACQSCFSFLVFPHLLAARSSLLSDFSRILIKRRLQQCYITEKNLNCVWMSVCATCCSGLAVVGSLPCSICHSFGVEDKHTDENDSDHKTICLDLSPSFHSPKLFLLLLLSFLVSFFFWEVTEVANRHFHSIVYVHISVFKHIFVQHMDQISNSTIEFYIV